MSSIGATEWGTDYWGEVMSEPDEDHARKVAKAGRSNVYSRSPMGAWRKAQETFCDVHRCGKHKGHSDEHDIEQEMP
jgi:hypothetical protein